MEKEHKQLLQSSIDSVKGLAKAFSRDANESNKQSNVAHVARSKSSKQEGTSIGLLQDIKKLLQAQFKFTKARDKESEFESDRAKKGARFKMFESKKKEPREEKGGILKDWKGLKGGWIKKLLFIIGAILVFGTGVIVGFFSKIWQFFKNIGRAWRAMKGWKLWKLKIFEPFRKFFGMIGRFFGRLFKPVGTFFKTIGNFFKTKVWIPIKTFFAKIRGFFTRIGKFLNPVLKLFGGGKGKGIFSFFSKIFRFGKAFGKLLGPIGVVIMIIEGIFNFVKGFTAEKKGGFLQKLLGGWSSVVSGLVGGLLDLLKDIVGWFFKIFGREDIWKALKEFSFQKWMKDFYMALPRLFANIGIWIGDVSKNVGIWIGDVSKNFVIWIGDISKNFGIWIGDISKKFGIWVGDISKKFGIWIGDISKNVGIWIGDVSKKFGIWIGDFFKNLAIIIGDFFKNLGIIIWNWVKQAIKDIGNIFKKLFKKVSNWVKQAINDVGKWIKKLFVDIGKWIGQAAKDIGDFFKKFFKGITNNIQTIRESKSIQKVKDIIDSIRNFFDHIANSGIGKWVLRNLGLDVPGPDNAAASTQATEDKGQVRQAERQAARQTRQTARQEWNDQAKANVGNFFKNAVNWLTGNTPEPVNSQVTPPGDDIPGVPGAQTGGRVVKTGLAKIHKDENIFNPLQLRGVVTELSALSTSAVMQAAARMGGVASQQGGTNITTVAPVTNNNTEINRIEPGAYENTLSKINQDYHNH